MALQRERALNNLNSFQAIDHKPLRLENSS